ncbi:hypothetical protein E2C01_025542 [Portunus trituberculatus]|uniref:Uncharacterized protein n=1 Tax=Portunus trituberculatus TaxID=210409 RepID=A0A5B7EI77_PORTR|nr:hypothetical protein [Portunus trituberculatus]
MVLHEVQIFESWGVFASLILVGLRTVTSHLFSWGEDDHGRTSAPNTNTPTLSQLLKPHTSTSFLSNTITLTSDENKKVMLV